MLQFCWGEILEALDWTDVNAQRAIRAVLRSVVGPLGATSLMSDTPNHVAHARAISWLVSKGAVRPEELPDTASVIHVLHEQLAIVNRVNFNKDALMRDVVCRLALQRA